MASPYFIPRFWQGTALFALLLVAALSLNSCDTCKQLTRNGKDNVTIRDSVAYCYFEKGQYESAAQQLEQLLGIRLGTKEAEKILYYLAYSKFFLGDYVSSGYFFGEFAAQFPASKYAEESNFMQAYSHYMQSSEHMLDQSETYRAIDQLQIFIQRYPMSNRVKSASELLMELRDKLALKSFRQADLYMNIGHYQSAVLSFKNIISTYPDSRYREEAQFKLLKSGVIYAEKSIDAKRQERFENCIEYYERFVRKFAGSKYRAEADQLLVDVNLAIDNLKAGKKVKEKRRKFKFTKAEKEYLKLKKERKDRVRKDLELNGFTRTPGANKMVLPEPAPVTPDHKPEAPAPEEKKD